ncbi:Fe-only nitrogenase accessory AnfO family protein [Acetobacterium sp.]|uniref:Fe-only nitrogenase accessory AnfO family protein n=1 Tax=Acetobacterium sp. TaxID=1872094 RepID=UPI002F3FB0F1
MKKENYDLMTVFFNDKDQVSSFNEMTHWVLYAKEEEGWQISKDFPCKPVLTGELTTIRDNIKNIINQLGSCRVIITKSITGIPYHTFDKAEFIICEVESFDLELLDAIKEDLIATPLESADLMNKSPESPKESDIPGHYIFDLVQMQKSTPEITSKMALLPFFKGVPFVSLDIVCEHIPPWFDKTFDAMKLTYEVLKKNDESTHVIVTHTNCKI